ncbi:MAG: tRNA (N(6)-L-threonylcarbamoyladenosine(37)-C(2))-methylthiotransferase MtaB [Bacteroidia bacterium]|nr:MAG: tRNA (N(6)-L-threonylcarbamoyladenosine(37)-C(2))-methylthiotransferase MtaB [Bacteroidia bacterium]
MLMKTKTIAFNTLGCKLNFSETAAISRRFQDGQFREVGFHEVADIYVINSCTVTQNAEKRCRELIRKAMKTNPEAHVAVIGCYSQISPAGLAAIPGVALVLGNTEKYQLFDRLKELAYKPAQDNIVDVSDNTSEAFIPTYSTGERTRSFFKIQDGCDYKCAYCIIPKARGKSRSNTIAATLATAAEIAETSIKEMVLTGVNIGDFGKPQGETFHQLLKELAAMEKPERIRLSSVEPDLLTEEIIRLVAKEERLMPHFHIPLQSGSDSILRAMGRRYNTRLFADRVETIRKHIPHACIAADVIVGYPGETEELFRESLSFLSGMDVSYVHVFSYSERAQTRAADLTDKIHPKVIKDRAKTLQQLSDKKKQAFAEANKGLTTKVLWEKDRTGDHMSGFTENYIRVKTKYNENKVNTIEEVVLNITGKNGVYLV